LSGNGGGAAPVVSISGGGVRTLSNLQVRNGDNVQGNGSGCGGGIRFVGRGELRLRDMGVSQNDANSGGGVCFIATGSPAAFTLEPRVSIVSNEATTGNGGGIVLDGDVRARFYALADETLIAFNRAPGGFGGAIYAESHVQVDLGAPSTNGTGPIYGNEAQRGGGIAAYSEEGSQTKGCVRIFTTDASRAPRIHGNRASEVGGAIYQRTNYDFGGSSKSFVSLVDARIDGNSAPNGAVAYLQGDDVLGDTIGSQLHVNVADLPGQCEGSTASLGRVACTHTSECNHIEGNIARDFDGNFTNGNVIELRDAGDFFASNITMRNNRGTRLISWSAADGDFTSLADCVLVDNINSQELIRGFNRRIFTIDQCTIANNVIGASHVVRIDIGGGEDAWTNLLIDQPGKLVLSSVGPTVASFVNQWIIATDVSTFRPDPTVQSGRGRFVDPAHGNYRLRIGSEALDYAPANPRPFDIDLDRRQRDVDFQNVSANPRARDVGGYERQLGDRWVENGNFVSDTRHWSIAEPTYARWTNAFNAPGSAGGSLELVVPVENTSSTDRRTAGTYCFNVPSGGDYLVRGLARTPGNANTNDYPYLLASVRYDSADCTGPIANTIEVAFGRSASSWLGTVTPLVLTVDPAQWTWNTTIEVRLDVLQNAFTPTATALVARFDDIEISKPGAVDTIFEDSFE
jgi:hypothetical protein